MATITRSVFINQAEPSPLSMRLPARQETRLALTFRDQSGTVLSADLGSQLELVGRSSASSLFYSLTATDIVNGKAQATIPAGALSDPNGYRLQLRGRVSGQPALLATGTVVLLGTEATGMAPSDADATGVIERIDMVLPRGVVTSLLTGIWADDGRTIPLDLTTMTLVANISATAGSAPLTAFSITAGPAPHMVYLGLTIEQLNALPDSCWWTLVGASPGSVGATTYCEGNIVVTGEVTP